MGYINVVADCSTLGTSVAEKVVKTQIYPNPTKDILYIKSVQNVMDIEIYDVSGRKVMTTKPNRKDSQVNLQKLGSGVYIMKTRTMQGEEVYKIIKKD